MFGEISLIVSFSLESESESESKVEYDEIFFLKNTQLAAAFKANLSSILLRLMFLSELSKAASKLLFRLLGRLIGKLDLT